MPLVTRLSRIDLSNIGEHYFLEPDDKCYYLSEYTSNMGYQGSPSNQWILNLKKDIEKKNKPQEYRYKTEAIKLYGDCLAALFNRAEVEELAFVPVPPSQTKSSPNYDDRLLRVLDVFKNAIAHNALVTELIEQKESYDAAHKVQNPRPPIEKLVMNYTFNQDEAMRLTSDPQRRTLVVFDDVLTAGCHFKAMQRVLRQHLPNYDIVGLFIARTVRNPG